MGAGAAATGAAGIGSVAMGSVAIRAAETGGSGASKFESSNWVISTGFAALDESNGDPPISTPSSAHTPRPSSDKMIVDRRRFGDGQLVRMDPGTPLQA